MSSPNAARPTPERHVVLIVEDEPLLRLNAVDMIEEAGFDTIEAADGDAAIAILEGRDDIEFVFTDIDMPGSIDGLSLASAVHHRWPPIHVLITSGHLVATQIDLPGRSRFVPKPYRGPQIAEMLHTMK